MLVLYDTIYTCGLIAYFLFICVRLDPDRIKLVGPDKACAEWLVKCGAAVGFHAHNKLVDDYTRLGLFTGRNLKLKEVYAEEATIMNIGFAHFGKFEIISFHYNMNKYASASRSLLFI